MDLEQQEVELAKLQEESLQRLNQIRMARVQLSLLRGNIDDAELIAASMSDRTEADQKIAEFKKTYAALPHGQWKEAAKSA